MMTDRLGVCGRMSVYCVAVVLGSAGLLGCGAEGPADTQLSGVLPNWATADELSLEADASWRGTTRPVTPAPTGAVRLPAEYEPMQAVLVTWTSYITMLQDVATNVAASGAQLWAVGGPARISGVDAALYRQLSFGYNSVWSRDYGPVGVDQDAARIAIVDTTYRHYASRRSDDAVPCNVAKAFGMSCHSTELILDGGNLMSDGRGSLFFTRRLYEWNSGLTKERVDTILKTYFGAKTLHVFDYAANGGSPADGTGHIDMFAKIIGPCKVIVAQTKDTPFAAPLDKAAKYFSELECTPGTLYEVRRVPGWYRSGTWYTYTNSLMVNDRALVPGFEGGQDDAARAAYLALRPDIKVVFIPSDDSITSGGAIHCITKEIPEVMPALVEPDPSSPTPATDGEVRLSEVMINPACNADAVGEYVELYNPGAQDIDLSGWALSAGAAGSATLAGVVVPAGGTAVVCASSDVSRNGGLPCAYEWSGLSLDNGAGSVTLSKPSGVVADELRYGGANEVSAPSGASLARTFTDGQPDGWQMARATIVGGCGDLGSPGAL